MKFLRKIDWGDLNGDLDFNYAFDQLYGKSELEVFNLFEESTHSIMDCLRFTNLKPFQSLILLLNAFYWKRFSDFEDIYIVADTLMLETLSALENRPEFIVSIMPVLIPTIEHIAKNQESLGADIDIYGNYFDILQKIRSYQVSF